MLIEIVILVAFVGLCLWVGLSVADLFGRG